jgi:hypothetical protein
LGIGGSVRALETRLKEPGFRGVQKASCDGSSSIHILGRGGMEFIVLDLWIESIL